MRKYIDFSITKRIELYLYKKLKYIALIRFVLQSFLNERII